MRRNFKAEYFQGQLFATDFEAFGCVQFGIQVRRYDVHWILKLIFRRHGQKLRD